MWKLNFKIALRNIWRHKLTTSIKLFGLIVGLSCVAVLVSYVLYELSYDKHNKNADLIYRVQAVSDKDEKIDLPTGVTEMLAQEIPEVETGTVLNSRAAQIKVGENFFKEQMITTEHSFFKMFTAPLVSGNPATALTEPNTAYISETFAKKAFPAGNAVGQTLNVIGDKALLIAGIIKDLPAAAHIHGDILTSWGKVNKLNWAGYTAVPQYLMIKKGASVAAIQHKMDKLYAKYKFPEGTKLKLMPLTKIHLYSHTASEIEPNSDIKYIYIFSIVAFFILFIALVNYINLTVASALKRGKEIGVKKVLGASVSQLRLQFLSESYIYFIVAALFVLIITNDVMPALGAKLGIALNASDFVNAKTIVISLVIIIISGFIAGFYPAIVLSKLMPVKTLKGYAGNAPGKFGFRRFLMVFQFSASALLIVCTLIIYSQLQYISNKKLGFDKDQVLVSTFNIFNKDFNSFKAELQRQDGIKMVSLSSFNPGFSYGSMASWTNDNDTTSYAIDGVFADLDFIKTLNIKVVKGRSFSEKYGSDLVDYEKASQGLPFETYKKVYSQKPILLNEAAVKMLNLNNPIDSVLTYGGLQGRVIGVISDFNGRSLHNKITPLAINLSLNPDAGYLYIKINTKDVRSINATISKLWKKHFPGTLPDLQFLDQHLEKLYQAEMRLGSIFISFAVIAIFLCCIGLFGMVYFDLEQRTREIAVRKILGASVKDLLSMLNSGFVRIVIIANLIIWPLAWYLTKEWLNTFYYRIELSYTPFLLALAICLGLTVLTVSLQAIKTIKQSPVDALKYE